MFLSAVREGAHFFHASLSESPAGVTGLQVNTGTQTFDFDASDLKLVIRLLDSAAAELASP